MQQVKSRVEEQPFYAPLFQAAYGHNVQNEQEILDAIAVFVNSIGSFNTKYDVAVDKYLGSHAQCSSCLLMLIPHTLGGDEQLQSQDSTEH